MEHLRFVKNLSDDGGEIPVDNRLHDKCGDAHGHGLLFVDLPAVPGTQNDRNVGTDLEHLTCQLHPGHVRHGGSGITRIGILGHPAESSLKRLTDIAGLLSAAGLETAVTGEPLKHVWAKLFVNVAINALTAIHRCSNGELVHSRETRDIMQKAVSEAVAVAGALAIPVEGDPVTSAFRVCEATAGNISSMHQDVKNQRATEIDAINGAVAALGARLGIPTPVNDDLVRQIRRIEASYRH